MDSPALPITFTALPWPDSLPLQLVITAPLLISSFPDEADIKES